MKVSAELLRVLMRTIRQVERLEGVYSCSSKSDIYLKQVMDNELYFSKKIKDQNLKKINYYENMILANDDKYLNLLEEASNKISHRELNKLLIDELKTNITFENHRANELAVMDCDTIDPLVTAAMMYYRCYLEFPNSDMKNEFATTVTNCYLKTMDVSAFHCLFSEAINSNYAIFNASILDEEKFVIIFLKLLEGQCKKNFERIKNTNTLIAENKKYFEKYGDTIENYINGNVVFTITSFTEVNNISYNTAKKYLRELVELEILQPIKVGKNNAFVYTQMYGIWIK